jgi:hypothetical protein
VSLRIPVRWEDATPQWASKALAPHFPGAVVDDVKIVHRNDGTNRHARLALRYAAGDGPASIFLKAHSDKHRVVHLRNGNLFLEPNLFRSGAELPLEHPRVYRALVELLRLDFLLIMEDLAARGADMRDATRPLTVDQVANGLRGLARLHSMYWGFSRWTHPHLGWVMTWAPSAGWQVGLKRYVPKGLDRGAAWLPAELREYTGDDIVGFWARYVATLNRGPLTLLHADAHVGNVYVLPGDEVGFLDWQVVRRGEWSQDAGYFLVGALTEADRRAHERDLLEHYRLSLNVPEHERPSRETAWERYRASHAYGLAIWLSTLGTDGYQSQDVSATLAQRYAAAFVEQDTLGALASA